MKKLLILINLVFYQFFFSQNIPQAFNWQGVVKDASGNILSNTVVGIQFIIHQDTATGVTVYSETHNVNTTENGLIAIAVGTGSTTDVFSNINWTSSNYYLEVALDITGGTSYTSLGTNQLLSVPYALSSNKSESTNKMIDSDTDTSITLHESSNDTIKFKVDGVDRLLMIKNRLETDPINKNTIIGFKAGENITSGSYNVILGFNAGLNFTENNSNIGIGEESLMNSYFSNGNVGIGASTLREIDGDGNVALGNGAGTFIKNGSNNVYVGNNTGKGIGIRNVNNNVMLGAYAGQNNDGSGNIYIGYQAGYYSGAFTSNKLYIENSNSNDPLIYGEFDNDLIRINGNLEVSDSLSIRNVYGFPKLGGSVNQVLTYDGSGITSWKDIPSSADNLGNHTATQNIKLNNKYLSNDGDNEGLFVDTSGKIGIGINNPEAGLHLNFKKGLALGGVGPTDVNSGQNTSIQIATDSYFGGSLDNHTGYMMYSTATNWGNTSLHFKKGSNWGQYDSSPTLSLYGKNVGIGVTNPDRAFQVVANRDGFENFVSEISNTRTSTSDRRADVLLLKGAGSIYYPANQSSFVQFESKRGDYCGRIRRTGTSSISLVTSSDRRLKENLVDTKFGLNDLLRIKIFDYNFIADGPQVKRTGFMAQELYEIYPEAIDVGGEDPKKNPWGVDYALLTPLLIKAVQDQQEYIDKIEDENNKIKQELEALNSRMEKIEILLKEKGF